LERGVEFQVDLEDDDDGGCDLDPHWWGNEDHGVAQPEDAALVAASSPPDAFLPPVAPKTPIDKLGWPCQPMLTFVSAGWANLGDLPPFSAKGA
jgi:hypothetical protein